LTAALREASVFRPTSFVVGSALLLLISADAAAQIATPFALPATPHPTECGIGPRSQDEIATLLATPVAEVPAAEPTVDGIPADHATTAFAVAIVREALACGNAHGFPGVTALLSDAALVGVIQSSGSPVDALTFQDSASPPPESKHHALIAVRDVVLLEDGRVAATATIEDPEHGSAEHEFALVLAEGAAGADSSDQYLFLIDAIDALHDATGDPETDTPTP
jgi:hypothetical protein